jgi:hypothetical protein
MTDTRNKTERLLNEAMDHICDTHEQPTDPRAWDHLLIYAPPGSIFNALMRRIKYDGSDFGSLTLGEVERATIDAKLP